LDALPGDVVDELPRLLAADDAAVPPRPSGVT